MNDTLKIIAEFVDKASAGLKSAGNAVREFTQGVGEGAREELNAQRATQGRTAATAGSIAPTAAAASSVALLAVGLAAAALAAKGMMDAIQNADRLDDLAEKTGTTAANLKDLSFAATIGGTSLDGLLGAMNKLGRAADKSADETSKQAETFKQLGVDTEDASGKLKSSEQLFLDLADAFKGIEDGPEKSAAAFRLFGGEAKNLMPLLNKGAEGIAAMKKESQELSGIAPEAFNAFAASSATLNDNLDKVSVVSTGFFSLLSAELVPVMNVMIEALIDSAKEGGLLRQIMTGLVETFKFLIPYVKAGAEIFSGFTSTVKIAGKSIGAVMAAIAAVASGGGIAALKSVWSDYKEDVAQVADEHVKFTAKLMDTGKAAATVEPALERPKRALKSLGKAAKDVKSELQGMAESLRASNAGIGLDESAKQLVEAQQKFAKDLKAGIGPGRAKALLDEVTALIAVGKATREATEAEEKYKAAKTTLEDYQSETDLIAYEATLIGKTAEERNALVQTMREEIALRKQLQGLSAEAAATITTETASANAARASAKAAVEETKIANQYVDDSIQSAQDNFSKRVQILVALYEKGAISITDLTRMQQEEYDKLLKKTEVTADKSTVFWTEAAKGIQDSMQTFFFDIMQGNMTSLVDDFGKMISKMVAQALAAQLAEKLFGAGFEKGGGMGGWLGQAASLLGGLFGGAREMGGPVSAGKAYLVGEKRPELFVPDTSGTIIPSVEGMGGSGVTVHMSVNATDSKSFLSQMALVERDVATMMHNATRKYNLGM